jgi:L-fuconolactonase
MFQKYVEPVLEVYGADRMMYGSDWPVCLLGGSYEDTISLAHAVTATLSAAEQDAIFGTTALAWYQIPLAIHKGHKNQAPD